jgi:hypothetical protein
VPDLPATASDETKIFPNAGSAPPARQDVGKRANGDAVES